MTIVARQRKLNQCNLPRMAHGVCTNNIFYGIILTSVSYDPGAKRMLTLEEFLRSDSARRIVREAVGEALSDLSRTLLSGIYGGNQLAYDVTAVLVGPEKIGFVHGNVCPDPREEQQDYLKLVTDLLDQTIAQRMTVRASARVAGSPVLNALAATSGMPIVRPTLASPMLAGNALLYLSEPTANTPDEVALVATCAGLGSLHSECYAEAMAALCKRQLLDEWTCLNSRLTHTAAA